MHGKDVSVRDKVVDELCRLDWCNGVEKILRGGLILGDCMGLRGKIAAYRHWVAGKGTCFGCDGKNCVWISIRRWQA